MTARPAVLPTLTAFFPPRKATLAVPTAAFPVPLTAFAENFPVASATYSPKAKMSR